MVSAFGVAFSQLSRVRSASGFELGIYIRPATIAFAFGPAAKVQSLAGGQPLGDIPALIDGGKAFADWLVDSQVQQGMTQYASRYKKNADFLETGRTQSPTFPKELKDKTMELLNGFKIDGEADISEVPGGASFHRALFSFGFAETMQKCAFTPQCAGSFRIFYGGVVELYMASCADLLAAGIVPAGDGATSKMDDLVKAFCNLTLADFKKMNEDGSKQPLPVYYIKTEPQRALWIPVGWLVLEVARQGPLIFGIRKSFMQSTAVAIRNFKACGQVMLASNGAEAVAKHNKVAEVLEAAAAD